MMTAMSKDNEIDNGGRARIAATKNANYDRPTPTPKIFYSFYLPTSKHSTIGHTHKKA